MDQIKVSDCIAKFVVRSGITHVFDVTGGVALHLIHPIIENGSLAFISCNDRRSATMAASIGIKHQLIDITKECKVDLVGVIDSVENIFCELEIESSNNVIPIVKAGPINIYINQPLLVNIQNFSTSRNN